MHSSGSNVTNGHANGSVASSSESSSGPADGYFTSSVAVQHKSVSSSCEEQHYRHESTSSHTEEGITTTTDHKARKVVWPSQKNVHVSSARSGDTHKHKQNLRDLAGEHEVDRPHDWMQQAAQSHDKAKDYEMDIQKKTWDVHMANHRLSRSRSKGSRQLMERARSFERDNNNATSLPSSRRGSFSRHRRSPSIGLARNFADQYWRQAVESSQSRPCSRQGVQDHEGQARRWASVGRLDVSSWEEKIRAERRPNYYDLRRPPAEAQAPHQPQPPPPPQRTAASSNRAAAQREPSPPLPPPPPAQLQDEPDKEAAAPGKLPQQSKDQIVRNWVSQSSSSACDSAEVGDGRRHSDHLERIAMDIAESVVEVMEKEEQLRRGRTQQQQHEQVGSVMSEGIFRAMPAMIKAEEPPPPDVQPPSAGGYPVRGDWKQIAERKRQEQWRRAEQEQARRAQQMHHKQHYQVRQQQHVERTTHTRNEQRQVAEEDQQVVNERRRVEEEKRAVEEDSRKMEEANKRKREEEKRLFEERRRKEEEMRILEDRRRKEEEKRLFEEQRRKEEEMRLAEERRRKEEEEKQRYQLQVEQQKLQEERRVMEEQRLYVEKKRKEQLRMHYQRQEEERLRKQQQESHLREQQERQKYEELKALEEQKRRESERLEEEVRRVQEQQQHSHHQLSRTRSFNSEKDFLTNQAGHSAARCSDQFAKVRTGQVNEKRNFWIKSSSTERLDQTGASTQRGQRKKWIGQGDWVRQQKLKELEQTAPPSNSSRPGSSLGQAVAASDQGRVRKTVEEWSSGLAKSRSSAAILQDDEARPRSRSSRGGSVAKTYDSNVLLSAHQSQEDLARGLSGKDIHTNQVQETISKYGLRADLQQTPSASVAAPAPSRHIGDTFAENKIGATLTTSGTAWRSASSPSPVPAKEQALSGKEVYASRLKAEPPPPSRLTGEASTETKKAAASGTPWRSASSPSQVPAKEPTLKLVNVSVDNHIQQASKHVEAKVHFSETAQEQVASMFQQQQQQQQVVVTSNTSSSMQQQQEEVFEQKQSSSSSNSTSKTTSSSSSSSYSTSSSTTLQTVTKEESSSTCSTRFEAMRPMNHDEKLRGRREGEAEGLKPQGTAAAAQGAVPAAESPKKAPEKQHTATTTNDQQSEDTPLKSNARLIGPNPSKIPFSVGSRGAAGKERVESPKPHAAPAAAQVAQKPPKPRSASLERKQKQPNSVNAAVAQIEPERPGKQGSSLPMPVSQGWYDGASREADDRTSLPAPQESTASAKPPVVSTPIPVLAGWFGEEEKEKQQRVQNHSVSQEEQQASAAASQSAPALIKASAEAPAKKHVDFAVDPIQIPALSPPPDSEVSDLRIEEISDVATEEPDPQQLDDALGQALKGNVKDKRSRFASEDISRGQVKQSTEAYLQRTSSQDREQAERFQRHKELEEIAKARARNNWDDERDDTSRHEELRDERARELQEIAAMRTHATHWDADISREKLEQTKDARARELQEIASMRSNANWDRDASPVLPLPPTEEEKEAMMAEAKESYKSAASVWQQRERMDDEDAKKSATPPTRRIGNLLQKSADEWTSQESNSGPMSPPPPPRGQSSRDYMREFAAPDVKRMWNAPAV